MPELKIFDTNGVLLAIAPIAGEPTDVGTAFDGRVFVGATQNKSAFVMVTDVSGVEHDRIALSMPHPGVLHGPFLGVVAAGSVNAVVCSIFSSPAPGWECEYTVIDPGGAVRSSGVIAPATAYPTAFATDDRGFLYTVSGSQGGKSAHVAGRYRAVVRLHLCRQLPRQFFRAGSLSNAIDVDGGRQSA